MLRRAKWRRFLSPITAPHAEVATYAQSTEWQNLSVVLSCDWQRRPPGAAVTEDDCMWILLRHAVLSRFFGYVQGYLYLALPLQHVLQHRKMSLAALLLMVGSTHCFGPVGVEMGFGPHRHHVVHDIIKHACAMSPQCSSRLHHVARSAAFVDNVCLRLLFIVFGQSFAFEPLLSVWDVVLPDLLHGQQRGLFSVCSALLVHYVTIRPFLDEPNAYAESMWGALAKPLQNEDAAAIIARAAQHV